MKTLGAEISVLDHGQVEIRVGYRPTLTQQNGFIHAGVLTSILDSACGYAAMSVGPEKHDVLSVEFKVNLLAPARGERFVARAAVKRAGKNLTVCTADAFAIQNGQEKVVATMLATMMNISPKH
ncbi:MAG TPA: PaaI family thioesterase [Terriglobales bacterium]|nr:PaaI family thioesterase [Terriglobales bacterium]